MSHQDRDPSTSNAQNLQDALDWLVPEPSLADVQFRSESSWTPATRIFAAFL